MKKKISRQGRPPANNYYRAGASLWLIIILIILIALSIGGFFVYLEVLPPVEISNTSKTGRIIKDEIWKGQINVTGDIIAQSWVTLTILPGTIVRVAAQSDDQHRGFDHPRDKYFPKDPDRIETQSTQIIIKGKLKAIGTPDNKIIFTSDSQNPTTYDWGGLSISHGNLEWAIVEYARYNNPQDVVLANSIIRNSLECCLGVGHSKPVSPQILNNDIYNCGHEGMDIAGGSPLIKGNRFHRENPEIQPDPPRGGNGVNVNINAYPIIEDNIFEKNLAAIALINTTWHKEEPGKKVIIRNNEFKKNNQDIQPDPGFPIEVVIMENNN